jgi:hypothetical protein
MSYVHVDGIVEMPDKDDDDGQGQMAIQETLIELAEARGWTWAGGTHQDQLVGDDFACPGDVSVKRSAEAKATTTTIEVT